MRASYTSRYHKGLIRLLEVLEFRSSNSTHRPVIAALDLIARYARGSVQYYPDGEQVPQHRGLGGDWADLVVKVDQRGRRRVVRMVYEVCTFQALREALRCKEIWVVGADAFRNPDEDLPQDFEARRVEHYGALRKPLDPTAFIDELRTQMRTELVALHDGLDELPWLSVKARPGGAGIKLEPLDALPEPRNLRRLKREIERQWGTVALIDMLKEAALRTGCLSAATGVGARSGMDAAVLAERLLLCVYGYGTNTGIKAAAAGDHGHSEDDLRYVRRRFLSADTARAMAVEIANATFAVRSEQVWGTGSTAVASDSTHFGAYDQNIFTQWHSRYGGRGVLIYWHVERKSMAIHSQLISCTASEVAAMVEGAVRHGTTMQVEANYTDSHGQSEIGFGITRLLGFDLLPRIKRINHVKLYRPGPGEALAWPQLAPAMMGRAIRWDLIAEQYDQMIKYATAIRTGTASTEAILRRFTRAASHPTYQAMLEVGRAQKTIFVARYLRDRDLQREIHDGLNVAEGWNGGNQVLFYGKGGDIATNRRDEQELSVACLHVLQAAVAFVNTLLVQDVLAEPAWSDTLTVEDRRGLTPLFWTHVAPYGEVRLNMAKRLELRGDARTLTP
jgi:TnpA family transposase